MVQETHRYRSQLRTKSHLDDSRKSVAAAATSRRYPILICRDQHSETARIRSQPMCQLACRGTGDRPGLGAAASHVHASAGSKCSTSRSVSTAAVSTIAGMGKAATDSLANAVSASDMPLWLLGVRYASGPLCCLDESETAPM